jgi:hypothetical protein
MCFYSQEKFTCGDFRWTSFAAHCKYEERTGRLCGMKLVNAIEHVPVPCRLCEKSETKFRRGAPEMERLNRWKREGATRVASTAKSQRECVNPEEENRQLQCERNDKRIALGQGPTIPLDVPPLDLQQVPGASRDADVLAGVYSDSGYHSAHNPSSAKDNITTGVGRLAEVDDARTEYSEAPTIAIQRNKAAVSELADILFEKVATRIPSVGTMRQVIEILPDALKAFALRIGYKAPTQIHRDIMFFIHKHR